MATKATNKKVTAVMNVAIAGNDVVCGKCGDVIGKVVEGETQAMEANGGVVAVPLTEEMVESLRNAPKNSAPLPAGKGVKKGIAIALSRIEEFKKKGRDTSNMMPAEDADGTPHIWTIEKGKMIDIIGQVAKSISEGGVIHNPRIHGRFIVSEMFDALTHTKGYGRYRIEDGYAGYLNSLSDDFMYEDMARTLKKMCTVAERDPEAYEFMSAFYAEEVVQEVMRHYRETLKKHIAGLKQKTCNKYVQGQKYVHIGSGYGVNGDVFVDNLDREIYKPLNKLIKAMDKAHDIETIRKIYNEFNKARVKGFSGNSEHKKIWQDAYKGWGAWFTMQNLILFHGCRIHVHSAGGKVYPYNEAGSIKVINDAALAYGWCDQGWKLLGMLKELIEDNHLDIKAMQKEWRNNG